MDILIRDARQLGAALRRYRRQQKLSQGRLGNRMSARQATVSRLEKGEPAMQLGIVMDALAALGLEIVVRPRTVSSVKELEGLF